MSDDLMDGDAPRSRGRHRGCATCSSLRAYERAVQYVQADETAGETDDRLPEAVGRLRGVPTFRGGPDLMRCPECGTWYLYESAYEFLIGFGGSYDEQTVTRLSDAEALGHLGGSTSAGGHARGPEAPTSTAPADDEDATARAAIGYATRMARAHAARAGRTALLAALPGGDGAAGREPTPSWFLFGLNLAGALIPHTDVLDDPDYVAFLRGLFADLFDFLVVVYRGDPARELAELYRAFGSGIRCGPVLPLLLLPEGARAGVAAVMAEVDRILEAHYEDERRRQDQMGY